jgi:two-component system, NarL family, sensor histidine kinase BarA
MTQATQSNNSEDSVLQRNFTLGELLDLDSFRDACESYAELFQIGFRILDQRGEKLVDTKGSTADFCTYLFGFPQGKSRCMQEVATLREVSISGTAPTVHNCFSGLRYLIAPIHHEGTVVGRILYGPYWPAETPLQTLDAQPYGDKFNPEIAGRLLGHVRKVQQDAALKLLQHLTRIIDMVLYTGYKQALTSRMHVEAVTASFTELQDKTRALQESYERLKELDRLKSNFLATMSHELRTPLTSVIGYSEMLVEGMAGILTDEQRDYVKTIMEKGENLLSMISSILDFSKVESNNLRLVMKPTNLRDIIRNAVSTVIPMTRKQGITVETKIADDLPAIKVDSDKIRQVLINILGNAVKFNRKDGRVVLQADRFKRPREGARKADLPAALNSPDEEMVRIIIRDSGIGIPKDKIHRIFDSFYQVDGSSTREYGGTGLGLAITKSFVENHGGTISVESELGQGSMFTVLLPVEQGS